MSHQGNGRPCGNLSNGVRRDRAEPTSNSLGAFARQHNESRDEPLLSGLTFHFPMLWSIELSSECGERNWHVSLINVDSR